MPGWLLLDVRWLPDIRQSSTTAQEKDAILKQRGELEEEVDDVSRRFQNCKTVLNQIQQRKTAILERKER